MDWKQEALCSVQKAELEGASHIRALAKAIGLRVDTARIADREKACRMIRTLRLLNRRMNGVEARSQETVARDLHYKTFRGRIKQTRRR